MIILQADNRALILASKYTFLNTNYSSGVSTFTVLNAQDSEFAVNAFLLLGNIGGEDAEIVKIATVNSTTGVITTTTPTIFAHAESTRATIMPYDKIRFFYTTTTTFSMSTPLTGYGSIQVSDWFSTYNDETYSTGYGWYTFYNSQTAIHSQPSNAIPYIGFAQNTTENILADFFSMLGNKELRLVTREDALSWASEGYGRMRNKLNLTNSEYTASSVSTLTILSGITEYDLETDFDHLIALMSGLDNSTPGAAGGNKLDIDFINLREAYTYNGSKPRYYIRGNSPAKIGFIPTPTTSTTYKYIYLKKGLRLQLNTDEVLLPNGGEFTIKDFMLYRAYQKFQNPLAKSYLQAFTDGLNDMIISSVSRDANLSSWGIQGSSNV